jgi:hypothetical protein
MVLPHAYGSQPLVFFLVSCQLYDGNPVSQNTLNRYVTLKLVRTPDTDSRIATHLTRSHYLVKLIVQVKLRVKVIVKVQRSNVVRVRSENTSVAVLLKKVKHYYQTCLSVNHVLLVSLLYILCHLHVVSCVKATNTQNLL